MYCMRSSRKRRAPIFHSRVRRRPWGRWRCSAWVRFARQCLRRARNSVGSRLRPVRRRHRRAADHGGAEARRPRCRRFLGLHRKATCGTSGGAPLRGRADVTPSICQRTFQLAPSRTRRHAPHFPTRTTRWLTESRCWYPRRLQFR